MKKPDTPAQPAKRFRVGTVKYLGRDNFKITDAEIAALISRHENGDFGEISDRERALNDVYIDSPMSHPNSSVQSRYSLDDGTIAISTTGLCGQVDPETEILFNNHEGGLYDGISHLDDDQDVADSLLKPAST